MRSLVLLFGVLLLISPGLTSGDEKQNGPSAEAVVSAKSSLEKLRFVARRQQGYPIEFRATSDGQQFQLTRHPSNRFPKRAFFILGVSEVSEDGKIRVERYVDGFLEVVHLPTAQTYHLKLKERVVIPIYFAEFKKKGLEASIYVRLNDSFELPEHPGLRFRLDEVSEDKALLAIAKERGLETLGQLELRK